MENTSNDTKSYERQWIGSAPWGVRVEVAFADVVLDIGFEHLDDGVWERTWDIDRNRTQASLVGSGSGRFAEFDQAIKAVTNEFLLASKSSRLRISGEDAKRNDHNFLTYPGSVPEGHEVKAVEPRGVRSRHGNDAIVGIDIISPGSEPLSLANTVNALGSLNN